MSARDDEDFEEAYNERARPQARRDLAAAARFFHAGRYTRAIAILEPLVVQYRDSRDFHYMLGASCLIMGDTGSAYVHLRRARQLDFRHVPSVLALAAVHVRRLETDKAVELYLEALELRPSERKARDALDFLRRNAQSERLAELAQSGGLARLYPHPNPLARWYPAVLGLAALLALALVLPPLLEGARGLARGLKPPRPGVEAVVLDEATKADPVTTSGGFRYLLTEGEAIAVFEKAKRLFREYRDEAALVEINRLALSNASAAVKAKADELKVFVRPPDFATIRDRFAYADVVRDPELFAGVGIAWSGMAANVVPGEKGPRFDLLVGYRDRTRLEGISLVELGFQATVLADRPIEVLGRIVPSGRSFHIEGLAVHELRD